MRDNEVLIIKNYLENAKFEIMLAKYGRCPQHWRNIDFTSTFNRLYYIEEGTGWIKIKNEEFYIKPGQLILMPQGVLESYSRLNEKPLIKYWCHFTVYTGQYNLFDRITTPYCIDVLDSEKVHILFKKIISSFSSEEIYAPLIAKGALYELLAYYLKVSRVDGIALESGQNTVEMGNTVQFIEKNLSNKMTIEELAESAHLHPNYFIKLFKKSFGLPPIQYINKRRLEKAKYYLSSTNKSVSEIAELIGYCNVYYFSQAFHKSYGISPSEFRNFEV